MMYLSQLTLNPHNRQVQREIGNPYQMHRTVMRGFPEDLPDDERVLYRLETESSNGYPSLLVQSIHHPDWSALREAGQGRYLTQTPDPPKEFKVEPPIGTLLRFRLRANPTIKKRREGHKHSNRVPLVHEEKQLAWLKRKGELHGFKGIQVRISGGDLLTDRIHREQQEQHLRVFTVQFDGLLQVTDTARFVSGLSAGIGPARAFGCGLLSVAPAA